LRLAYLTLAGSRYLLTEFSNSVGEQVILDSLKEIISLGMVPIIAHPERYVVMWEKLDVMQKAKEMGAFGQISMGDLIGRNGQQSHATAYKMLEQGLCQFCATDAHTPDKLSAYMKAISEVAGLYGDTAADRLFRSNPLIVLKDGEPEDFKAAID
jgi:protein-tyrosine phosphatase